MVVRMSRLMLGDTGHIVEKGRTVWVLLIILLTAVPGVSRETVRGAALLNTFITQEACQQERNRIGFEMAEAYPGENDFLIACKFREDLPDNPKVPEPQGTSSSASRSGI